MTELRFTLPFPPSINSMYRQGVIGGKFKKARASMFMSQAGKDYRLLALEALQRQGVPRGALKGRLAVIAVAYPPDARVRDLDNLWKSALDCLKHNAVIDDDGFIDDLHVRRSSKVAGGLLDLTVKELTPLMPVLVIDDPRPLWLLDLNAALARQREREDKRILDALNVT